MADASSTKKLELWPMAYDYECLFENQGGHRFVLLRSALKHIY